jgi:hypothetical protein
MSAEPIAEPTFITQSLQQELSDLRKELQLSRQKSCESADLGKLFEALAKAQLDMEVAKTDQTNPFFKSNYADLASIVKASRPFLAKNGLSVAQRIIPNDQGQLLLFTRLCHASGQWMESMMPIVPPKNDIQTIGSYITYLRRYNYAAMVGVVASGEDDDGETAMAVPRANPNSSKPSDNGSESNISKAQLQVLADELEGFEEVLESLLKGFKIAKLSDLPAKNYTKCLQRIREIKRAKEA